MKISWYVCLPVFLLLPYTNQLYYWELWLAIISLYILFAAIQSCMLTAVGLAINNTVTLSQLGSANGMAQAAVSLFRAIGPAMCGAIFGWSTNNGLSFPLDTHLLFIIISCLGVICLALMYIYLDDSINYQQFSPIECSPEMPLLTARYGSLDFTEKPSRTIILKHD